MRERIATAAILIPVALCLVASTSPLPISIAAAALAAAGVFELTKMFGVPRVLPVLTLAGIAFPFYAVYVIRFRSFAELLPIAALLFAAGALSLFVAAKRSKVTTSVVDLGGLWIAMPLLAMLALHDLGVEGHPHAPWRLASPLLLLLVPVWVGDIAALAVGKAVGSRPLSAHSPNKTLEGAAANLLASLLAAWGIGALLAFPLALSLGCGLCAGVFGQIGDLFESFLKRRAGVKDSGALLPGHGGILDRIDSLLFAALPVTLLIYFGPGLYNRIRTGPHPNVKTILTDPSGARIVGGK